MPRINHTGIRSGEYIIGVGKQCKNTLIQVKSDDKLAYPPSTSWIDPDPIIRDAYNEFPFFRDMSLKQRKEYLLQNAINDKDLYLQEVPIMIRFLRIEGEFFISNLTSEQISELLTKKWYPIQEVYDMFPRKPGSKARFHTLIFRPNNWDLFALEEKEKKYKGYYIYGGNLYEGKVKEGNIYPLINNLAYITD